MFLESIKDLPYMKQKFYQEIESVCPECFGKIKAVLKEEDDGKVYIYKKCPKDGDFKDLISSDAAYYKWTHYATENGEFAFDKIGDANPPDRTADERGCPWNCGLCNLHKSTCSLALIDVTNRCNLTCNFCYANVEKSGVLVEPSLEEIRRVMKHFRSKPIPAVAIMFTGGEPTVRKEFPMICKMAKEEGFKEVLVATNGYGFQKPNGEGLKFAKECWDNGLDTLYFQFDGIHDETYMKTRNAKLWKYKQRVMENCRAAGFDSIVFVCTLAKSVTDMEAGNIIQYAIDNIDIVRGIIFQPVSLCGRISYEDLRELRITNADVLHEIEKQTNGALKVDRDWYPLTTIVEFGRLIAWYAGVEPIEFTCHPDCGFATYMVLDPETKTLRSFMEYIDPLPMIEFANKFWKKVKERKESNFFTKLLGEDVGKTLDKGLNWLDQQSIKARFLLGILPFIKKPGKLMEVFSKVIMSGNWESISSFSYGSLLIGSMHFQDPFNFNIERAKRCIVHFGVPMPDGSVLETPFCVYNNFTRGETEKKIAKKYTEKGKEEWVENVAGPDAAAIAKSGGTDKDGKAVE